jgi:hypothetical protein
MKTRSSLMSCCNDDESTTNQISRTIRPISAWDTWKSWPICVERITDATVPIGTDLVLRQACCEDGKKNFETAPNDDAYKKHCIPTNISRIWTMVYRNHIFMILTFQRRSGGAIWGNGC